MTTPRLANSRVPSRPANAWAESFGEFGQGNGPYYLATAFDRIYLQPSGSLGLTGVGKDLKVSVAFDDPEIGTKQLLVAFAGLERDWESA